MVRAHFCDYAGATFGTTQYTSDTERWAPGLQCIDLDATRSRLYSALAPTPALYVLPVAFQSNVAWSASGAGDVTGSLDGEQELCIAHGLICQLVDVEVNVGTSESSGLGLSV